MVYAGMGIGVAIILLDVYLEKIGNDFRVPVLAVAVGIYLPFELDSAIMVGGIIAWLVTRYQNKNRNNVENFSKQEKSSEGAGLLFASGLITGEALLGILLAVPVAIYGSTEVLAIADDPFGSIPGLIIVFGICYLMYRFASKAFLDKK
jgi:putative OPT family oligopeptide transporter